MHDHAGPAGGVVRRPRGGDLHPVPEQWDRLTTVGEPEVPAESAADLGEVYLRRIPGRLRGMTRVVKIASELELERACLGPRLRTADDTGRRGVIDDLHVARQARQTAVRWVRIVCQRSWRR